MAVSAVRVLGIDPGSRLTGFGVIDLYGQERRYVASGCIRTPQGATLPERIKVLLDGLSEVVMLYAPHEAAVEQVFVNVNPAATLMLGQARGALLAAATRSGAPVAEYTALQVKQAVVGYGKAQKVQVQEMVRRLLALAEPPPPDAADALACAICHAHQSRHPLAAAVLANVSGVTRRKGRLRWDAAALAQLSRNGEQR